MIVNPVGISDCRYFRYLPALRNLHGAFSFAFATDEAITIWYISLLMMLPPRGNHGREYVRIFSNRTPLTSPPPNRAYPGRLICRTREAAAATGRRDQSRGRRRRSVRPPTGLRRLTLLYVSVLFHKTVPGAVIPLWYPVKRRKCWAYRACGITQPSSRVCIAPSLRITPISEWKSCLPKQKYCKILQSNIKSNYKKSQRKVKITNNK